MPNNKGRVPGSGKNYSMGKGKKEYFPGGGYMIIPGKKAVAKYLGSEGPKKSSPRNSAKATKKMVKRGR